MKLSDIQRMERALRAAELEESRPALPSRLQTIKRRTVAERLKLYGRKVFGPQSRQKKYGEKKRQIDAAVDQLLREWEARSADPLYRKPPRGDQVVARLRSNVAKYFPLGSPYTSPSKFEREVRLALARRRTQSK